MTASYIRDHPITSIPLNVVSLNDLGSSSDFPNDHAKLFANEDSTSAAIGVESEDHHKSERRFQKHKLARLQGFWDFVMLRRRAAQASIEGERLLSAPEQLHNDSMKNLQKLSTDNISFLSAIRVASIVVGALSCVAGVYAFLDWLADKSQSHLDPFYRFPETGLDWYPTDFLRDVVPIPCHSHNDYWRKVPLFSALYAGCTSVEADVWDYEDLLVGHNHASLTRNRTFQSLYINPLMRILERQNPMTEFYNDSSHGVFDYDHTQSLTLLIDVKTDGKTTWPKVLEQLQPLRDRGWLTFVNNGVVHRRAVTVVGTGQTPFDLLTANQTYRDAFFDAPMQTMWVATEKDNNNASISSDKGSLLKLSSSGQGTTGVSTFDTFTPSNSYYASTSFLEVVGIVWFGRLTQKQLDLIRGHTAGAHERGLIVRWWETPGWPRSLKLSIWRVLLDHGADVLNVDDLDAVQEVW